MIRSSHFFILVTISLVFLAAGLYYAFVVMAPAQVAVPVEEVVPSTEIADGEYFVTVVSVIESTGETQLSMEHVTYFEGEAAASSAEAEVECGAAIETCVPTLEEGYYVRPSGAPSFKATLQPETTYALLDPNEPTLAALKKLLFSSDPVFVVTVKEGEITRVVQKTS